MEWVETTAPTIEEAKDRALDRLGVVEDEAEFEVIEEPGRKLFRKTDARLRARIRPQAPRAKKERRRRGGGQGEGQGSKGSPGRGDRNKGGGRGRDGSPRGAQGGGRKKVAGNDGSNGAAASGDVAAGAVGAQAGDKPKKAPQQKSQSKKHEEQAMSEAVTLDEQVETATSFLEGLLASLDAEADIERVDVEEDIAELRVTGPDLGLLVGPRGTTLSSLNEVTRTVLQRIAGGRAEGRVRVDVAGYRERRREALAQFTAQQAALVVESGQSRALEPMSSVDRKVVHDTANDIEGVTTVSEGDDPRRWVVIVPTS